MSLKQSLPLAAMFAVLICLPRAFGAQPPRPPAPKVEILAPAPGAELQRSVQVRVRITPPEGQKLPTTVFVGIDGPPWVQMTGNEQTGQWAAELDSTLIPNGPRELTVVTDEKRARAAIRVNVKNPLKVFFADLHSHTSYSDGTLTPAVAHQYARDVAKLDVFSLTDHLEKVDDTEWLDTREVAWDSNEDGKFVVIPGLEWTKKWGHVNVYDPKTRHWPEDPQAFYEAIAAADVVAKFNHPGDGTKAHDGLAYSEAADKAIQMMEVRRDEEERAFIRALNAGWHLAPEGSDDTHNPNWGNCGRWTGILAPGLSKRCIWDALKNRRVYSTLDRNCQLRFMVNGAVMGAIVPEPVQDVETCVQVADADPGDVIAKLELFEDGKIVETDQPNKQARRWTTDRRPEPGKHYYFVKVTQGDGNLLWSAPVWVTVGSSAAGPGKTAHRRPEPPAVRPPVVSLIR